MEKVSVALAEENDGRVTCPGLRVNRFTGIG